MRFGLVATLYTGDQVTNLTAVATNTFGQRYVVTPPGPAYFPVWGGTNYHLAIYSTSTNFGLSTFAIDLSFVPAQPNDGFADRTVLTGDDVDFSYNPIGASVGGADFGKWYLAHRENCANALTLFIFPSHPNG